MKILVNTYDTAFQNTAGGVHKRIDKTVNSLKSLGVQVDYFDKFSTKVENYDVLHTFMLKTSNLDLIKFAKSKGLKIVLSSIINLRHGFVADLYWLLKKLPLVTTYKALFQLAALADVVIVETEQERKFINKHYHIPLSKIEIIPSGVDDTIHDKNDLIYNYIGKKCDYAVEVGRFDKNKNQLNVIKAMAGEKENVVFVGGADFNNPSYYQGCIDAAKGCSNIHFLGWQDSESDLLKSAYANAKAVICSSYQETFGLSIVEGILAGAYPVVSKTLPILNFESMSECETFNPNNLLDIKKKINRVMSSNLCFKNRELVKSEFSWDTIARKHVCLYTKLVENGHYKKDS